MQYFIEPKESPTGGLQRLLSQLLEDSEKALKNLENRDTAVHEARKNFKKIRALLRLVRGGLGEDIFKEADTAIRDAGRLLSDARDSGVLVHTIASLAIRHPELSDDPGFTRLRTHLQKKHQRIMKQLASDGEIPKVLAILEKVKHKLPDWTLAAQDFSAFYDGLLKAYQQGQTAMLAARDQPEPEKLHDWRKRVKDLSYQLFYLKGIWPAMLEPHESALGSLGDLLGEDHDLAVLRRTFETEIATPKNIKGKPLLPEKISAERKALQAKAWPLGHRLYCEEPAAFIARMVGYWQAMRMEMER